MAQLKYEVAMKRLEEIVKSLEEGKLTLEDSVKLFEEGARLASFCSDALKNAEMRILTPDDADSLIAGTE